MILEEYVCEGLEGEAMQAIQGIYDYGRLNLFEKPPARKAKVIVIFTEEPKKEDMSTEEALRILNKYAGGINATADAKAERLAYLDERYGSIG